jgi:hypothetical protein
MNLPALKGGVSCRRCIVLRGSFCKEIINCGGLLPFFVSVTGFNRPKGRGIRPPLRINVSKGFVPAAARAAFHTRFQSPGTSRNTPSGILIPVPPPLLVNSVSTTMGYMVSVTVLTPGFIIRLCCPANR